MQMLRPRVATLTSTRATTLAAPSQATSYRIRGRALQAIREQHFKDNPLCVNCLRIGRVTAATQVDHTVPLRKGGADTANNRQSLCDECHKIKTIQDLKD